MNRPRCDAIGYIQFLIASKKFTYTETARCPPRLGNAPAHDSFTRLLQRQSQDTETVWKETKAMMGKEGVIVVDDTTLDKPYASDGPCSVALVWQAQKGCQGNQHDHSFVDIWQNTHPL
ncbi:MAG: hypothetical protein ACREBI_00385 [Nitrosotalea sp.]